MMIEINLKEVLLTIVGIEIGMLIAFLIDLGQLKRRIKNG